MSDTRTVFLFISTGRCGTQWLASNLSELYGERAAVTHEPLGPLYRPRLFFRSYEDTGALAATPEVAAHLERVDALPRERLYVETGWPLFAAVPLFVERFGSRLAVIHLTRHPVPTSISHMVHQCYAGSPRDDGYTRLAALDPGCPRVFQPEYAARWSEMSPYEKCLYWWTEVHLYGLEIQSRYPEIPFLRCKSEDVLSADPDTLERLADFLHLDADRELAARVDRPVDRWNHRSWIEFDWRQIFDHPRALAVAEVLGYNPGSVEDERLEQRYVGPPHLAGVPSETPPSELPGSLRAGFADGPKEQ
ncbi:MAG: sulfotransferase domain-containing protein [Actinomycetota bacterium]|nr:sulfotransferase domain-containing protein [Actinomycetota bacterium]